MKTGIALIVLICVIVLSCFGQQPPTSKPTVSELIEKLHSKDWTVRSDAVDEIRDDPEATSSRKVQTELISLLTREMEELDEESKKTQVRDDQNAAANTNESYEGEGYGEYIDWLSGIINTFADWNNPEQVRLLVRAGDIEYPSSPTEAEVRAKAALPYILKRTGDKDARAIAVPMLVEALAKGRNGLDIKDIQNAKQIILTSLHDADVGVRGETVVALGNFGTLDAIPVLEVVARSDPASDKRIDTGATWFPIRELAIQAIGTIHKRLGQFRREQGKPSDQLSCWHLGCPRFRRCCETWDHSL
jgi:HEAT repeat protein